MKPLGRLAADDCPGARFQPRLFLFRRERKLGGHVQEFLRHDGHLREEVLGVLVNAAEPRLMRGQGDAGDPLHPRFVGFRQGLDNGNLVAHHQAILAGQGHAAGERLFDRRQKTEQNKRHHNREQRQDRAEFLPLQVAPDQVQELHRTYWAANAACWAASSACTPDLPKTSISASWASLKVASSPVPCSSMNSPAESITRLRSTSAATSSV